HLVWKPYLPRCATMSSKPVMDDNINLNGIANTNGNVRTQNQSLNTGTLSGKTIFNMTNSNKIMTVGIIQDKIMRKENTGPLPRSIRTRSIPGTRTASLKTFLSGGKIAPYAMASASSSR